MLKNPKILFVALILMGCFFVTKIADATTNCTKYISWDSGNDTTGDGSIDLPWKTFSKAYSSVISGSVVCVQPNSDPVDDPYVETTYLLLNRANINVTFEGLGDSPSDVVLKGTSGQTYHVRLYKTSTGSTISFKNLKILSNGQQNAISEIDSQSANSIIVNFDNVIIQGTANAAYFTYTIKGITATSSQFLAGSGGVALLIAGSGGASGILNFTDTTFSTSGNTNGIVLFYNAGSNITGEARFNNSDFIKPSGSSGYAIGTGTSGNAMSYEWKGLHITNSRFGSSEAPFIGTGLISIPRFADYITIEDSDFYISAFDGSTATNGLLLGVDGPYNDNPFPDNSVTINNNRIYSIGAFDISGHGILIGSGINYGQVYNNALYFKSSGSGNIGIVIKGTHNDVYGNIVSAARGIDIKGGESNNIYNNTVYAKSLYALQFDTSGCYPTDPPNTCYYGKSNTIKNNIFDARDGTYTVYYSQDYASLNSNNFLDYNLYYSGSTALAWDSTQSINNLQSLRTVWSGLSAPYNTSDTNSLEGDPNFIDTSSNNFSLMNTSSAINAGTDMDLASDYIGTVIPQGVSPDIGAYEYLLPSSAPTIGTPSVLSSSLIRWNFVDGASNEDGFRIYDNTNTLATSSAIVNLTYLDETGLSENTQYSGRYVVAYNSAGESSHSSTASSKYTLVDTPTNFSASSNSNSITLSVDVFPNYTGGQSGYYFSRSGGGNSGWIQTNSWTDTGLSCEHEYTYSVKYRNGDGIETSEILTTKATSGCGSSGSPANWTLPNIPQGGFKMSINGGVAATYNRNVVLNFNAGVDIKKMEISMTGDFTDSLQEDYIQSKQWDLCSKFGGTIKTPTCPNGKYTVYVRFYTIYGRSSNFATVSNTINLKSDVVMTDNLQKSIDLSVTGSFTKYLRYQQTNDDIKRLQIFLNSDPDTRIANTGAGSPGKETNYFGLLTREAVIRFQEKYAKDVLVPWGFKKGTGYVGRTTLNKINELVNGR